MEGAEDVDGGIGVADHEHRGSAGGAAAGAVVGVAAANAAATRKFTIHHPPEANGAGWNGA